MAEPFEFKIVIAGPFGVGKTTLITNISNVEVVGTEVATSGSEAIEKGSTTVGLEYGVLEVRSPEIDINLLMYGTPGQERFRFMWDAVAVGADGFVILVDATRPETWNDAAGAVAYFSGLNQGPCVVGANRAFADSENFQSVRSYLQAGVQDLVVVPCNVLDVRSSKDLLVATLEEIIKKEGLEA